MLSIQGPLGETSSLTFRPLENFFNEKKRQMADMMALICTCFVFVRGKIIIIDIGGNMLRRTGEYLTL